MTDKKAHELDELYDMNRHKRERLEECRDDADLGIGIDLSEEHIAILDHTAHTATCGLYCGDSPEMQDLVKAGLMEFAGKKSFVPDPYFRITKAGKGHIK